MPALARFKDRLGARLARGFAATRRGKAFSSGVTSGGDYGWTPLSGGLFRPLPGSQWDYQREAGNLWANSIVLACLKWQSRVFPEAPPLVQRRDGEGKWQPVPEHPFAALLDTPNGWYDGVVLWQASLLSFAVKGDCYWYKLRSGAGKLAGYQWLPHFRVRPYLTDESREQAHPIAGYRYYGGRGEVLHLPAADVLHIRDGIDPEDPLCGLSPLGAVLREVCTDNEAATFMAALLRNMGLPGAIISP
ncbi:MAG TPA: phage portal protein, partial [Armatimonadota bacterium]|nr:phage portal protein [Armatimonadota bacterium]